ncbi:MAG: FAD-dependent thymidylate synthase, partial [Armatimonadota bacterium]
MPRTTVPEAEALLDQEIKVLDKGFVRLVDYMGGDQRIVQAARVSYGEGTKSVRQDRALIHYLIKHWHTSPFEQVQLTFHCKMPIFIARQWIRHRTARLNEISGRYSIMKDEFYVPEPQ